VEDPRTASLPAPAEPADDPEAAPSFVVVREGRVRLLVAATYEQALRAAGLTDAARLGALTDGLVPDRTRNAGRAATCILETERGPVFVKRALKGGALGPLFAGRVPRFARVSHEIEVTAELHRRGAPVLEPVVAAGLRDALGWRAIVGTVFVQIPMHLERVLSMLKLQIWAHASVKPSFVRQRNCVFEPKVPPKPQRRPARFRSLLSM